MFADTFKKTYINLLQIFSKIKTHISINDIYFFVLSFITFSCAQLAPIYSLILSSCVICKNKYIRFLVPIPVVCFYAFTVIKIPLCFILFAIVAYTLTVYAITSKKDNSNKLIVLLFTIVNMLIVDSSYGNFPNAIKIFWTTNTTAYNPFRFYGIFIVIGTIFLIDIILKDLKKSGLIVFNFVFFLGAVNYFVYRITTSPFKLSDITLATTAKEVISNVQITKEIIFGFIAYLCLCALFNFLYAKMAFKKSDKSFGLITISICLMLLSILWFTPLMFLSLERYGIVSHLLINVNINYKPSGYNEFLTNYPKEPDTIASKKEYTKKKPNVIFIMNEAFSDLSVVGDLKTNKDYMPYTRSLMKNCGSGYLYSSVFGNNTVSSEFESLTGIPTGLTTAGANMYSKYIKENTPSLANYFNDLGYETIGIHPYSRIGYNRCNAWKNLGFKKTYWQEDFEGDETIRGLYSDKAAYEKIIEKSKTKNNYFIYTTTMQNHATYKTGYKGDIKSLSVKSSELNEYLSLIKKSDEALKELIDYFKAQDEETIIVFFGDHQPMIDHDDYSKILGEDRRVAKGKDLAKVYQIPYFVWSNKRTFTVDKKASINYIPEIVISASDLPKTQWISYLETTKKEFPIVTDNFVYINGKYEDKDLVLKKMKQIHAKDKDNPLYKLKEFQCFSYKRAFKN